MVESTGGLGLHLEPINQLDAIAEIALDGDSFERDGAADHVIVSLINNAHCAAAEFRLKHVPVRSRSAGGSSLTSLAHMRIG